MKKNNNKALIIIFIILVVILLIVIAIKNKDNNISNNNIINNMGSGIDINFSNSDEKVSISESSNTNLYFSLNTIINSFNSFIYESNKEALVNILSKEYTNKHNINKNNILNVLTGGNSSFYIKDVIVATFKNTKYYFLSGESMNFTDDDIYDNLTNEKYIIKVKNGCYSIEPIDSSESLSEIARNYKYGDIDITQNVNNEFNTINLRDDQIAMQYNYYFLKLLNEIPEYAYNMLSSNMKGIYPTYDVFYSDLDNIKNIFSSKIYGMNVSTKDETKIYFLDMYGNYNIVIKEQKYMTFDIEFK